MIENLKPENLMEMYSNMVRIRLFEEECSKQFTAGKIQGFLHLYLGEEAIAVGVCANLRSSDFIVSTHRGHGHLIARGADMRYMMAEMFGKSQGYNRGKGGDMHLTSHELGVVCTTAIVGGNIPVALGPALSSKMKRTDQVTVCFFGDGASNQGTFHESLNLASIWNLPVVFVVENSQFAVSTSKKTHQKVQKISTRALGYDIPGMTVDGNDVLKVYKAAKDAIANARAGKGPTLLECVSYNRQQSKQYDQEITGWEEIFGDPLEKFEKKLENETILSSQEIERIRLQAKEEVEAAVVFADQAPWPETATIVKDVYAQEI